MRVTDAEIERAIVESEVELELIDLHRRSTNASAEEVEDLISAAVTAVKRVWNKISDKPLDSLDMQKLTKILTGYFSASKFKWLADRKGDETSIWDVLQDDKWENKPEATPKVQTEQRRRAATR